MSASLDSHLPPHPRAWAPRTADLDNPSTSDIREEHTSDLQAVVTHDVSQAVSDETDSAETTKSPVYAPLVQTVSARTQDLEPQASEQSQRQSGIGNRETGEPHAPAGPKLADAESTERRTRPVLGPGTVLADRYLIEQTLGSGGTALVFRARDLRATDKNASDARVAIKTPRFDVKDRERAIARLQHEFKHAQALAHPHIARVLQLGNDDQTWFMTMELIDGRSLATLLRDSARLPDAMRRTVLSSCAEALAYAHSRDIVHGDFKPANVLVSASGQVKVFDFGAASSAEGDATRIPAGTPAYASPQVLNGVRPDPRDDVFSFACVAYELLAGQHPFERRSSLEARQEGKIPSRAWNLSTSQWLALLSALSWERERRPSDIASFAKELLAESPSAAVEGTQPETQDDEIPIKVAGQELPEELVPAQRSWGFFVFVAVAFGVFLIATTREIGAPDAEHSDPSMDVLAADALPPAALGKIASSSGESLSSGNILASHPSGSRERAIETPFVPREEPVVERASPPTERPPASSTISFDVPSIVTSESSIAAVFVITRSGALAGRTTVEWRARSGSAEIDRDFITAATGTVEFADGQSQRAVYIPLRNDEDQEGDETFTIELVAAQRGKLSETRKIEATIRDDD